jgi:hypothetical protein
MDFQGVVDDYLKWVKDNTVVKTIAPGMVGSISTPFLDRHNDHITIYVEKNRDYIMLTDDGYTIADLSMSGLELTTPKRAAMLKTTLNGFGVNITKDDELFIEATNENIGQKKHALLQAVLAVNDMFYLSKETVYSLFKEDVELYFRTNDIIFSADIKLVGKSGFDHNIDFLIPSSRHKPERLVKTVNSPKNDSVLSAIMAFGDISQVRGNNVANYVVYNDLDRRVTPDVVSALDSYGVKHIPWSEKERCIEEFSLN